MTLAARIHAARDLRIEPVVLREPEPDEVVVALGAGGICGSDLSYYGKGRVGDFSLREPMVLGHEVAGTVARVGAAVTAVRPGERVAVDPSRPCRACDFCRAGRSNLCRSMRFFGSAAVFPHVQGAFSEEFLARADQCVAVPDAMPMRVAACGEPLAVALHGVRRAGELLGRHVVIAGAGPIGLLCLMAARLAGARRVVCTDLAAAPLAIAREIGAAETVNVAEAPERLAAYEADKGTFDVALEATGSPAALASLFRVVRPGGRVVQLGMMPPGDIPVPANLLMAREIDFVGAFRFHEEFRTAVSLLAAGRLDVGPILSAELPMGRAGEAFALAGDRSRAIKVHLTL
ncbi:L-idonate 5-dehydrogenase (NAD(P)(+)) [Methylobacterium crusticola]|uniref:L-idonate 5-dehydrogenase (NAD(P)(+)) n=1 Tax=Methylobacterium crusticola TaxID=1697972 RepID=A0ABQ4QY55_9HYPH|nr:L-idonate 5-dehydrogenase [Methylobacterium crusticola]GJD50337.1 L-idonate 5-dehydrogenase (NAD(P)(+)) [Methylobacterium crusticola]